MACKIPWVELIVDKIEKIHQVYYKVCIKIKGKKKLLVPKIDFLWKHTRKRQARVGGHGLAMGKFYFSG
jgi:hypothetical protein